MLRFQFLIKMKIDLLYSICMYMFSKFSENIKKKKNDSGNNKIFLVPSSPVNLKQ